MDISRLTMPLGYTLGGIPVYPLSGAAPEQELEIELEESEDEEPPEGGEPEDEGSKGKGKDKSEDRYVPPSETEWARVRASLDKANASAKAKRLQAAEMERRVRELEEEKAARDAAEERRQLTAAQQQPSADTGRKGRKGTAPSQPPADLPAGVMTPAQVKAELAKAKRAEREAVQAEYVDMARRSAAKVALSDAQVPKASLPKLIKLLDLEEIELDSDGEVVGGLDEQIEALKAELPQLFAPPAALEPERKSRPRPPRIPQANGSGRQPASEEPKTSAERLAAIALGGR